MLVATRFRFVLVLDCIDNGPTGRTDCVESFLLAVLGDVR